MAVILKTKNEIEAMRKANEIVVRVLKDLRNYARVGVSTKDLEKRTKKLLKKTNAKSAFLGYRGYPALLCTSINEEVVHGIPSEKRILEEGDILSIDFGVEFDGFIGDAAITFPIGRVNEEKEKLMRVGEECLDKAISATVPDNRLSDISKAVSGHAEKNGLSVVYQFVGHGIGRKMHEEPQVPNCGTPRPDLKLVEGMVIAIEPMINTGVADVVVLDDGWTAVTADKKPSAHFEKSVAISENGPDVLSAW